MFGDSFDLAEIKGRLCGLDREGAKDRMELRLLRLDVRSLENKLTRLFDHLKLEEKWVGSQIVNKEL